MSREQWIEINLRARERVPRLGWLMLILVILGAVGFYMAFGQGIRAWQAYWVNFLYFAGLAQAGVIIAALVHSTGGRWGGALVRLGLLQVAFVPVTLVLYIGIVIGSSSLLPWVARPVEAKAWWLNQNFFLIRVGIALVVIAVCSLAFAYFALRPDAGAIAAAGKSTYLKCFTRKWRGEEAERERSKRILGWLGPLIFLIYAIVYSLIGFDMVMSLEPHWSSNLFGGYFFLTALYMGAAEVIVIAALLRKPLGLESQIDSPRFHDMGKVLFAFCLLSADFFWSQFLVIWYGDLPEEISFILHRIQHDPWVLLSYAVLFGGFVLPFIILINRRVKQIPWTIAIVGALVLIGGFAERILLVIPSLNPVPGTPFPIGLEEALITLGFLGLYGASLLWMLRRAPLVPAEMEAAAH
jgi:Ni/Fe-hydrogenase subunit HybB-like protein